jgi:hypothetical protein
VEARYTVWNKNKEAVLCPMLTLSEMSPSATGPGDWHKNSAFSLSVLAKSVVQELLIVFFPSYKINDHRSI